MPDPDQLCPYCDKELNFKAFKQHRNLYYDLHTKKRTKLRKNDLLDDDTSNSEVEFSLIEVSSDVILLRGKMKIRLTKGV